MILYKPGIHIELAFFIPCIFFLKNLFLYLKKRDKFTCAEKFFVVTRTILFGVLVLFCLFICIKFTIIPMYSYYTGNYKIVEGEVENFIPMQPSGGSSRESFSINDVEFEYSTYIITMGYRKTKYYGGVIKGNGQLLKIGYIEYDNKNVIIFIEE